MTTVTVENPGGSDRWGKERRIYLAVIGGTDATYGLARSFVKGNVAANGVATIPDRDGVYELTDHPDGEKRRRYYLVHGGEGAELQVLTDADVLSAVDDPEGAWLALSQTEEREQSPADRVARATRMLDETTAMLRDGIVLDQEDMLMLLDKVREALE